MAKYYGDIAKSAKGTCVRCVVSTRCANVRASRGGGGARRRARRRGFIGGSSIARARRRFARVYASVMCVCGVDCVCVRCIDGVCVCVCVDLFTGGFSYDHKFSVDTKTAGTVRGRALERAA